MLFYVLLALGIVSTVVFITVRAKQGGVKALLLKGTTSALFVATAVAAASQVCTEKCSSFVYFVIAGLVFGLMGDIWLDLKWIYPQDNDIYTFAGFGSFLIGHILFTSGIIINFTPTEEPISKNIWYYIIPVVISAVIAIGMVVLEKPMKSNYGKFKLITAVYSFFLALTTFMSGSLALINGFKVITLDIMFAGGVFFMLSDLILCGTYFGEGKRRPVDVITNHAAYYIAQFLIASSLLFLK